MLIKDICRRIVAVEKYERKKLRGFQDKTRLCFLICFLPMEAGHLLAMGISAIADKERINSNGKWEPVAFLGIYRKRFLRIRRYYMVHGHDQTRLNSYIAQIESVCRYGRLKIAAKSRENCGLHYC